MIREAISKVVDRQDLSEADMILVMNEIMSGEATPAQIGSFITALRMKGETIDEIVGAVKVMREKATRIDTGIDTAAGEVLVDIVGTGGDGSGSFNVSTTTSFVVAAAGVPVAKHGNYAISSKCGSANVLDALGVRISSDPAEVQSLIQDVGIGFMLAPAFHPAMKRVGPVRRELGIRTVFNILGPLTNPAGAKAQVMGVYDPSLCEKLAHVLQILGAKRAMVVNGEGMDEITNTGQTRVSELKDGSVKSYTLRPEDLGYPQAESADIAGGMPDENAKRLVEVLKGETSAARDIIVINSGAAVYVSGLVSTMKKGASMAEDAIDSGEALKTLQRMVKASGEPEKLERFL